MTQNIEKPAAFDAVETIKNMNKSVTEMAGMLRAQQGVLALRGMSVSTDPMDQLQQMGTELGPMQKTLSNDRTELQQLRELARTSEIINSVLDIDAVLNDVIDTVIALTGAERGYIVLRQPETGELEFRVARQLQQNDLASEEFIVSRTVVERVAAQGEPIVTINAQEDSRFKESESVFDYMLRSILCVPLKTKGNVIGVIYTDNRWRQGLFGEREQRLVYAFANQAAIAIENVRLFERVRANLVEITTIKEFMDNVFASIASGVIAADQHDLITALNNAASRILALQPDEPESVGRSLWSVLPALYEGFERLIADVRLKDKEQIVEVEPVIEHRGQVNLTLRLSPFKDSTQTTQGVAIVLDDVTEAKQRQEQFSVLCRYLSPAMFDNLQEIDELEFDGVEREISVVYCDVRGFSTFSEKLAPELVMEIVNWYLAVSSEAITAHQGIVDKYMGDAAVGLFNTQLNPQTDHTLRAVKTALRMVKGVEALYKTIPAAHHLTYGIGITSGLAILGNVGSPRRKEFTAVGDTLDFAKLLQENGLGNEIIMSEPAYRIIKDQVIAEQIPARKMKDQFDFKVMYVVKSLKDDQTVDQ